VHGKFALGLAGRLEIHQTDSLLALSRAEVPTLETAAAQATHRLALLLGEQPADLGRVAGQVGRIPQVPAHLPLTLPSDLLRQRPDIRAAERQLAAATATVGATVAELFPRFSLGALLGLQASSLGDLLSRSSRFWTIGPAVRWPLFDAGAIRAGIEISEARRDQARVGYEKTLLTALAETEDALVALDRERVKQQQLATAVVAADQALTAARGLYTAGLTPFLNVLQSEATLFQARDRLAESDQRLALALVALYKALGGGWQSAAAEPHPAPPPT
jgi:NodT family efflux transporter outer membrane factor (OMF) lipoprotein